MLEKLTYYSHLMRLNAFLIVSLLVTIIAAPIVDAIACDDCKDTLVLWDAQQCMTKGVDHSEGTLLSSDAGRPAPQETGTTQDLCPVCSDTAAAMKSECFGTPSMISQVIHFPQQLALSAPSYPINKPPQI